ncbi:MAG: hypothetical protein K0R82_1707 [Flavipsychrobacter sp.]|nr:hypothetical protein [Flavipsychrobacter sp.]
MRLTASLTVLSLAFCLIVTPVWAQDDVDEDLDGTTELVVQPLVKEKTFYASNALDMGIFSTSTLDKPGNDDALTPLRFTWFINFGININHDFSNNFGVFSGLGIKNIGFIERHRLLDSTVKRRVYTLGAPLGIKIGNLKKRNFVLLGVGADLAYHYKEKGFTHRLHKDKTREWFSDRTPLIMPHVFLGASFDPGITIKAQYYFNNFLNTDFTDQIPGGTIDGVVYPPIDFKPYAGYDVNLLMFSVGFDLHYKKVRLVEPKDKDKRIM